MDSINNQPRQAVLQVAQQAVGVLAEWSNSQLSFDCICAEDTKAIARAKQLLSWPKQAEIKPLRLLFDQIKISDYKQSHHHYWPAVEIANSNPAIPYPDAAPDLKQLEQLKSQIKVELENLSGEDWQNLSLLTIILEKFGSHVSFGEADIALFDLAKATGAIATVLAHDPDATQLSLVAGDLSGIQKFIYTISSDGALKSLRARSFYLELVTEEVAQQLLQKLQLPRTNIIYVGGGNLYLLAPATEKTKAAIEQVRYQFNQWLLKEFQGKIFLSLSHCDFKIEDVGKQTFATHWEAVVKSLAKQKSRKFNTQISDLLAVRDSYEPCKVCHRDDVKTLNPLNPHEADSVMACPTCRTMFDLGSKLFQVKAIVRSPHQKAEGAIDSLEIKLPGAPIYYHLFTSWKQVISDPNTIFLINDWTLEHYQFRHFKNVVPLLLGNYGQQTQQPGETGFMPANEMAEKAAAAGCIPRVGYLRMDVDNLGRMFAKGLGERQTLPRLAGLSRQMSYFFKVYLNSLAADRKNLHPSAQKLNESDRPNLLFIYAGGDDLFVSGAWNEVAEFAFDVYQSFRAYTGQHPDITLSAGISLSTPKYPLYQAADESGDAEGAAKANGRDSLSLFDEVFKWGDWLGREKINTASITSLDEETQSYLGTQTTLDLFGVLPFVNRLNRELDISYSRSFIRNLLVTAQIQEQMIKDSKDKNQARDIRYFLHLPRVAYTLARLPQKVRDDPDFEPIRTSLKSPYNAPYFRAIATWIDLLNRA